MTEIDDLQAAARQVEASLETQSLRAAAILQVPARDRDLDSLETIMAETQRERHQLAQLRNRFNTLPPFEIRLRPDKPDRQDPRALQRRSEAQRYFVGVSMRLSLWGQVTEVVAQLVEGRTAPLYPRPAGIDAVWSEQLAAFDSTLFALHKLANPASQSGSAEEHGCYADIPLPPTQFVAHAHAASRVALAQGRARPVRFLDIGCGGGVKLLMASGFFEAADGLEYDPAYAEAAGRMLATVGAASCRVMEADALTFDDYAAYDVIYFYQPMRDTDRLRQLERRLLAQARPGTILIAPYAQFSDTAEDHRCARLENAIFIQGLDDAEAAKLRQEAEHIGAFTRDTRARHDSRTGYMLPLIDACQGTGFFL